MAAAAAGAIRMIGATAAGAGARGAISQAGTGVDFAGFFLQLLSLFIPLPLLGGGGGPPPPQSIVRIAAGLADTGTTSLGGQVPGATVWNENGVWLGSVPVGAGGGGAKVGAGEFVDVVVDQVSNQQPTNLQIAGGADSVCVAYVGHTWPDGTKRGWLGDMGRFCGKQWYYSKLYVTQSNGSTYAPSCTWIGGSGSSSDIVPKMTIHTPDFSEMGDGTDLAIPPNPADLCQPPRTRWNSEYVAASGSVKRASLFGVFALFSVLSSVIGSLDPTTWNLLSAPPPTRFQTRLIGSHRVEHNSTVLCADPKSYGPSFVSFHENAYCDMTTRKTWPLCRSDRKSDCYDWDSHSLVNRKLRKRKMLYTNVEVWKA